MNFEVGVLLTVDINEWNEKLKEIDKWFEEVTSYFSFETWNELGLNVSGGIDDGFETMIKTVKNAINDALTHIENGLNGAIDWLNGIIEGYNHIATLASWDTAPMLETVSLPRLAQGAVFQGGSPYMAIVNDQPAGQTNIETPLATMIEAFQTAMAEMSGTSGGVIEIVIDGKVLGTATLPYLQGEANRIGTTFKLA